MLFNSDGTVLVRVNGEMVALDGASYLRQIGEAFLSAADKAEEG